MRVNLRDENNIPELMRTLRALKGKEISVGVHEGEAELSMIAAVHEYGVEIQVTDKMRGWFAYSGYPLKATTTVITIPERSFIRSGFDENVGKIERKVRELMPAVIDNNMDPDAFMDKIGLEFAGLIQKKLRSLQDPANSSMTTERKGSSNPLIDSGRLVGAIQHRVE